MLTFLAPCVRQSNIEKTFPRFTEVVEVLGASAPEVDAVGLESTVAAADGCGRRSIFHATICSLSAL